MNCNFSQKSLLRGRSWLVLCLSLMISQFAWAEGTRQVAPNPANPLVMLDIDRQAFGNFASYNGPEDSRLVVTFNDPSEVLNIGLSIKYNDVGRAITGTLSSYRFRIVNEAGQVVHGPFLIDGTNANVSNWQNAVFGQYDVSATQNGFDIFQFSPDEAGDYRIEFQNVLLGGDPNDPEQVKFAIGYWDFTVTQNNTPVPGRVWSKNWAFRTPTTGQETLPECEWNRSFNGVLYSYTTDGFVSRIDFSESGFQGLSFNVAFNSTGPGTSGNLEEDRKSVPGENATASSAEHRIFLNEPDPMVFPDGDCGGITSATTFSCTEGEGFCLDVTVSDPGQVEIIIDFNQNGMFDPESTDVSIVYNFPPEELQACVPWNGLRGDSSSVAYGDTVDLLFTYTRGVQHYAVYDVEFLKNGFCVETVRPICGNVGENRLFWDDRDIDAESGTGQPKDGRGGCECGVDNCRTWDNFNVNVNDCSNRIDSLTTGYGDKNTINTWWYASSGLVTRANIPLLSCLINGSNSICDGASTEFTVEVSGAFATYDYSWSGPNGFTSNEASTGPISIPGEYCVTVTNELGCERVCCEEVVLGSAPELSAVITDATCDAAEDGIISVSATGGQGSYQFSLNGGDFQTSGMFAGFPAGDYEIVTIDELGCTDTLQATIGLESAIDLDYPDVVEVCFGSSSMINPIGDASGLIFSWEPATGIDDPTSPTPTFSPTVTTIYTVTVRDVDAPECFIQREVTAVVSLDINPQVSGMLSGCEPETTLTASSDVPATFTWLNEAGAVIGTGPTITLPLSGEMAYTLQAQDAAGCVQEIDFTLSDGPVDVSLPDTLAACTGDELQIMAVNQDPNDVLTYSWTPAGAFAGGTDTASPDYIEVLGVNDVYVDITNQFGCTYRDTVNVAILDANATYDFEAEVQCDGATVVFNNTSTGAFGFIWDFGDGTTSTEVSPTHIYSTGGSYTVQLTSVYDAYCVSTKVTEIMVTEPELIAGFTYDLIDCSAESATIAFTDTSFNSMDNTVSWSWTFSDGQTSSEQNPTITFNQQGEITVTLTIASANDCEQTATEVIDIQLVDIDLPDVLNINACPGESIVLNPGGNPDYEYTWTPATGLDDPTAASPVATPTETTVYTVTVLNVAGSDTCAVMRQVTVEVAPAINLDLGDDIITCGEDAEITYTADVPVTIQWTSANEGDLGSGPSVTVNPLRADTIFATATDVAGCMDMDTIIIIDQGVDVTTDPLSPITTCGGQETTITIINQDQLDELTYSWSPTDNIVGATDGPSVTVVLDEGTINLQAIVTNQFDCADTVTVAITAVPFDPVLPDTVYVCAGTPTAINPDFTEGYTYQWSPEAGLDDPNAPNPVFTGDQTTVYNVTVADNSQTIACERVDSVVVFVYPALNLETTGDTILCESGMLTLEATTDIPATITWYDDADLTNVIGMGNTVEISTPTEDGMYVYTAVATDEDSACSDTSSVTVTVNNISDNLPDDMVDVCADTPTPINPNGDPELTYEWSPADNLDLSTNGPHNPIFTGTDTTTYSVTVSDPTGVCVITKDVTVAVSPPINLTATGDTTLCENAAITLTATSEAVDISFTWYDNPELSGDPVGQGSEITVTPAADTTLYTVLATDAVGCTEQDTVTVIVTPIMAEITPPQVFCEPTEGITIMVTNLDPSQELTYQWSPTDATDPDEGPIVSVDPNIAEDYMVTVTNTQGCELVLSTSVQIMDLSQLEISAEPMEICLGESTTITVSGCEDCTYTWTGPGDITPDDGPVVTVTPDEDGMVTYTVMVEKEGCTETLSISIMVTEVICTSEYFFLPNAFTPNGDNINDILRVRSNFLEKITGFELQIYNRWGDLVFKTENPDEGWDGTYKGRELPPDVYGFFMLVDCPTGDKVQSQGNVSLLK